MTPSASTPGAAHLPDVELLKAKVAANGCLVYQPYLNDQQLASLDPQAVPLDISFNTEAATREYELFRTLYDHHRAIGFDPSAFWGLVSSKFALKAATPFSHFVSQASEAQRAGFDCYAYNPMLANAAIFLSAWDQGIATGHVGMDKIFDYLAATGYPVDEPQGPDTFFFCNYFVANDRFWRGYFSYCEAILYALEQEAAAGRQAGLAYIGHGNYARDKNTSMRPFVIERLLGLYIASARTSGLKVAGFVPQAEDFARKFGDRMGSALFDLWSKKNDGIAGEGASRFETWKEARFAIASQPILALHADDPPAWLPRINKL